MAPVVATSSIRTAQLPAIGALPGRVANAPETFVSRARRPSSNWGAVRRVRTRAGRQGSSSLSDTAAASSMAGS